MARQWTKEQRAAQSRRMKAGMTGQAAQVSIGPTEEQLIIAQSQGKIDVSQEDIFDLAAKRETGQEDTGSITHQRPGMVQVYKPTPWGYTPRLIPVTNLPNVLSQGWKPKCPDCGGFCTAEPNSCSGREKVAYRICPVAGCKKRVYDFQQQGTEEASDDPSLIQDEAYIQSTPAARTKAGLDVHILSRHPTEARAAGLIDVRGVVSVTGA